MPWQSQTCRSIESGNDPKSEVVHETKFSLKNLLFNTCQCQCHVNWTKGSSFTLHSMELVTSNELLSKHAYFFSNSTVKNSTLEFLYQEGERILPYQVKNVIGNLSRITLEPNNTKYNVTIVAKDVGELLIHFNTSSIEIVGWVNLSQNIITWSDFPMCLTLATCVALQ